MSVRPVGKSSMGFCFHAGAIGRENLMSNPFYGLGRWNSSQPFVRVIGRSHNAPGLKGMLGNVNRAGALGLETRYGRIIEAADLTKLQDEWVMHSKKFDHDGNSVRSSLSTHIVFATRPDADRASFQKAVRAFVKEQFGPSHDYAMAFHYDLKHPHSHLVVLTRDDEGKALVIGANLFRWRQQFAEKLRTEGIEPGTK